MRGFSLIGAISVLTWFGSVPAWGHPCDHGYHHEQACWDCGHARRSAPTGPAGISAGALSLQGKVTEVIYLPGATAETGMVEIRLQASGKNTRIRLAPSGILKQSGLVLREGDDVAVKGYRVDGMDGELLIATEVQRGEQHIRLRDAFGRAGW